MRFACSPARGVCRVGASGRSGAMGAQQAKERGSGGSSMRASRKPRAAKDPRALPSNIFTEHSGECTHTNTLVTFHVTRCVSIQPIAFHNNYSKEPSGSTGVRRWTQNEPPTIGSRCTMLLQKIALKLLRYLLNEVNSMASLALQFCIADKL